MAIGICRIVINIHFLYILFLRQLIRQYQEHKRLAYVSKQSYIKCKYSQTVTGDIIQSKSLSVPKCMLYYRYKSTSLALIRITELAHSYAILITIIQIRTKLVYKYGKPVLHKRNHKQPDKFKNQWKGHICFVCNRLVYF